MHPNRSFNANAADFVPTPGPSLRVPVGPSPKTPQQLRSPAPASSSLKTQPRPQPQPQPVSELDQLMIQFDQAYEKLDNVTEVTESDQLLIVISGLIDEICLEIADVPQQHRKDINKRVIRYYTRYFKEIQQDPDAHFPLTTNIILLPGAFKFLIEKAKTRKKWLDVIFEEDNLYWLVMNCITHGQSRSWATLRNLLKDVPLRPLSLFISHLNSQSKGNTRIIVEASALGFKDHRLEYALTLLQRRFRRQPLIRTSDPEKMIGLRNLHGVAPSHLDENSTVLAYNKGLYPHILSKMLSHLTGSEPWTRDARWIEAYRSLCPEAAGAWDERRQALVQALNQYAGDFDMLYKMDRLRACADLMDVDIFHNGLADLNKLRFSYHQCENCDMQELWARVLSRMSYRTAGMMLDYLPWFSASWGQTLVRHLQGVDLKKISDGEIRFWFFQLHATSAQRLVERYGSVFKVSADDLAIYLTKAIEFPVGLEMPGIGPSSSSTPAPRQARQPRRRGLLSRLLFGSNVKRIKARLLVESYIEDIRQAYKEGQTPKDHQLSYAPITVHPVRL